MRSHEEIWALIDRLAERYGISTSALARKAGLDPTAFNKSKRISSDGRPRWPSTESIAKILDATGASLADLLGPELLAEMRDSSKGFDYPIYEQVDHVPLLGMAEAAEEGFFDDGGHPVGKGWDEVSFPGPLSDRLFALEVTGHGMDPVYRDGDILIISPNSELRRGDRVVVRLRSGEILAKTLLRQTKLTIDLGSLRPDVPDLILRTDVVDWMARIIWASQ